MKRILIILFILSGLIEAKDVVDIKANRPGQLVIELSIDSTWISSNDQSIHTIPSLDTYFEPGFPIIPYYQEVLIGVPANASVRIFSNGREPLGDYNPTILGSEKSKGLEVEFELPIESKFNGYFPNQNVKLSPTKDVNGTPSSKIEVFPISIQDGQLFVTKNISVQISWDAAVHRSPAKILSKTSLKELKSKKILKKPTQNIIPDYQFSSDIAKIIVDASAWYKISNSELLSNGINLAGVNPNSIRVWNKDDEIPVYIEIGNDGAFNNEDMIVFYGEINSSPEGRDYDYNFYTNDNVYWLTWGAGEGLRFAEKDVSPDLPASEVYIPEYFTDTLKVEKEQRYFRLNYNNKYLFQNWDITDHIFMAASVAAGGIRNITFKIYDPISSIDNSVEIEVLVYGVSYNDHVLNVNLNDNELLRVEWSGQSSLSANNYNQQLFSSDILQNGDNVLSLLLHKDDPSANDRMEMNWFKLIYPRYFRATNDYLEFNSSENNSSTIQFNIQNVSSPEILLFKDKNKILLNYTISNIEQDNYDVSFQDDNSNSKYELIAKDKLTNVKQLTLEIPIQNQLNSIQNTYIAICPDSFKSILEPLLDIHNGVAVDVEDIYRQYNGGILSPYAIKAFLSDLYYNNNLEYVLIAMQNNLYDQCCSQAANQRNAYIPAMHIFVYQWGDLVSDYWYSLLEGDDYFPEIAVGRFPAANSIELQEMVRKTMFHINRNPQIWDNNALLIGGSENVFIYQSEDLANNFIDKGQFLSRIYVAADTTSNFYYSNTDTLLNHFNRGLAYVNFLGHGGAYVWSDAQLLNRDAIEQEIIRNGNKTPFVTSMTCFTGDISRPNSLGRYMLTNQYGGAYAWFGSAGPGWQNGDFQLVKPLQKLLLSDEDLSVGELINKSKMMYSIANSYSPEISKSQLYQFNLMGDPAIKVKKPLKENVAITPLDPEPGENIEITSNEAQSDSVFYQIFLPDNYSLNQSTLLGNSLPENLSLPDTLSKGIHKINISYKSDDILYNSSQLLSVAGSYVNIQSISPSIPTICDSIDVIAEVTDRNGIFSVQLILNGEYWAEMNYFDTNLYSLEILIPPQPSGTDLNLVCQVVDLNNDTTRSLPKIINIGDIPNIVPIKGEFKVDDEINLSVDIENTTTTPVSVNVELFIYNTDIWQLVGKDTVNFVGMEIKEAIFPGFYRYGTNDYKVTTNTNLPCISTEIATDDTITFSLETKAFWVTPQLGSTDDGIKHSKVGIKNIEIDIAVGIVTESSIIKIDSLSNVDLPSQSDFKVTPAQGYYNGVAIDWETTSDYLVNWTIGKSGVQSNKRLYRYFEEFRTWLTISYTEVSDSTISFPAKGSAKFTFLENTDVEKPTISATINGQKFLRNNYLSIDPIIQFSVYDNNGIDPRNDSIFYWINNNKIMNLNSEISGTGNNINITINPTFTKFDSTLAILVQDAAGNSSDTLQLSFIISEKLDLIDYGNYPNPFTERTVFAYELTDVVEKFTFTIYTVEGRKIRQLDNDNIISGANKNLSGYHEIEWDGKNQDGHAVGNGNYFYQIRAKNNKTVLERTGKILKVN